MCILQSIASQLLRLAQTGEAARPGWSPDGTVPRSLPVLARGLRLSAGADVDRATQRDHDQSQGCSEADEPDGDSLGGEEAQASSQRARHGQAVPLSQPAQPGLLCGAAPTKMGHRYDPHPHPARLGHAVHDQKDLYDGFIVAYRFGPSATIQLVAETLRQALEKEMVTDGLILHSDQGHQFRSQAYYVLITAYNLTHSMSRKANCWDNAPMENFFSHLKEEAIRQHPVLPFKEVKQIIQEYIAFFNYERIQLKTKQTPYQQRFLAS